MFLMNCWVWAETVVPVPMSSQAAWRSILSPRPGLPCSSLWCLQCLRRLAMLAAYHFGSLDWSQSQKGISKGAHLPEGIVFLWTCDWWNDFLHLSFSTWYRRWNVLYGGLEKVEVRQRRVEWIGGKFGLGPYTRQVQNNKLLLQNQKFSFLLWSYLE